MTKLVVLTFLLLAGPVAAQELTLDQKLEAYTYCYERQMQMDGWEIGVRFADLDPKDNGWLAEVDANTNYLTATITYDTTALSLGNDIYHRRTVVHELWHILLWELAELAEQYDEEWAYQLEEQLNTRIERWKFWLTLCQEVGR